MCVSTWTWLWADPGLSLADPCPDSFLIPRRSSSLTAWMKASRRDSVTLGGMGTPPLLLGKAGVAAWGSPGNTTVYPWYTGIPPLPRRGAGVSPGNSKAVNTWVPA